MTKFQVVASEEPVPHKEEVEQVLTELEEVNAEELPPISEMIGNKFAQILGVIITPFTWLIALPIRAFAWFVTTIRTRRYDPEKLVCPACGFKGDSGTNNKSCRIQFTPTTGNERAAIQHFCFRCGCDKIFSRVLVPADKWMAR